MVDEVLEEVEEQRVVVEEDQVQEQGREAGAAAFIALAAKAAEATSTCTSRRPGSAPVPGRTRRRGE